MGGESVIDRVARVDRQTAFRAVVGLLVVVTAVSFGLSYATYDISATAEAESGIEGTLVATIDALGPGQIVAYHPNGSVMYQNRTYGIYHDVDPVAGTEATVEYVATDLTRQADCETKVCSVDVVERLNLTTDEVTRLHTIVDPSSGSSDDHDVDRVNDSVLLFANINFPDSVYMVNTTTDERIWEWNVSEAYDPDSGGSYPGDWTHLNDVEYLEDGRVMVSLRNQDSVVFIEPGEGLQENWTLGADGNHDILYEQHNPDYIPESRGGPAIIVADSENNRIVEYQRVDGEWERSWAWTDPELRWPRDADRLPDGRTLIADSHGSRILIFNQSGEISWQRDFPPGSYDVEILETGDESAGGQSMASMQATNGDATVGWDSPTAKLPRLIPSPVLHGVLFALPLWATPFDAFLLIVSALLVAMLSVTELIRWYRNRQR